MRNRNPLASTHDVLPLNARGSAAKWDASSSSGMRPFGLRWARPADPDRVVDVSGVVYDRARQIGTRGGVPIVDVLAMAGSTQTPYTTTEDHQKWTDYRTDRPAPR